MIMIIMMMKKKKKKIKIMLYEERTAVETKIRLFGIKRNIFILIVHFQGFLYQVV